MAAPSMQEVIQRLNAYWAQWGCTLWQPYSEKVGAGTMNPATTLRVLGPEPWNVAYVEPSYRPDDGRYAENPNRMQMHTQYQVILKPDPGNPQELYLGSLAAIGLDLTRHDIRFVEDNWESPALGAWGLGWEVWLDGQEITQFTYFQQAGSLTLDPVSVEITYGLERIVMYLQGKTDVWSIDYDGVHTYADLYRLPEIEHCVYNFELADVERQKELYAIYKAEAERCIQRGLVIPAYDYILRQSHTFNVLDARGAIGVTERAKFFADMRSQARRVAELYVEQRRELEFPWLRNGQEDGDRRPSEAVPPSSAPAVTEPQTFLLELGSEELPPKDVVDGIHQIRERLAELLDEARLDYQELRVTGTPRRLVALVTGLAPRQRDETVERKGPPVDRAFDSENRPTRAAQGFARSQGVEVSDLVVRDRYVYAIRHVAGRPTLEILPQVIADLLDGLRWGKTMRWNATNVAYPRPLRWIVALYGSQVVPVTWAGVTSGNVSRGPRWKDLAAQAEAGPGSTTTFSVASADAYLDAVAAQGILLDREQRRQRIAEALQTAAARVGGRVPDDPELLEEVTDLVEAPTVVRGTFEESYLELPEPVLISVMKKHQRYFPVVRPGDDGQEHLLPYFLTVANADRLAAPEVVQAGNEGVIRARYADAAYFYRQDTSRPLESFTPRLATLTFHEKLGSMLDKVHRLEVLAPQIAAMLGGSAEAQAITRRAAALCKSDLVTAMVIEMTSLQGIMGEIYALKSGESPEVAQAIREHYLPRFAGDAHPETLPGLALSLADKLDSLAGLFGVGVSPRGSADPFGLRRAALGVVHNLLAAEKDFSVRRGLEMAAQGYGSQVDPGGAVDAAGEFVARRLQGVLLEMAFPFDVVEAVLAERGDNPYPALRACRALARTVQEPWWNQAFVAYARCARIVREIQEDLPLRPEAYTTQEERALHQAYLAARERLEAADEPAEVLGEVLRELQEPINRFFEAVLVNAEEEAIRRARQALVQKIAWLPRGIADLSRLQGF